MKHTIKEYQEVLNRWYAIYVFSLYEKAKAKESYFILQELIDDKKPIKPKIIGHNESIVFTDGRKTPELYVGACECSRVVYSNWVVCPYCTKVLDWNK